MRRPIWWIAGGLIVISAVVLFFAWRANRTAAPPPVALAPPAAAPLPPAIANPLPGEAGGAQPLPALNGSDAPLHDALGMVIGLKNVDALFKPEMLIRHIVVTVDNLPRKHLAVELRPTKPIAGQFVAAGDEQKSTLDPSNYQRYSGYVQTLQMLNTQQFAALYIHYYPLFQQAYQDLGYPNGYFNDRLVQVIDNLLATPELPGDVALARPNVMYQYADAQLEDLSSGQKTLLRMGPANAAIVKAKLRELREQIANQGKTAAPVGGAVAPVGTGASDAVKAPN